jgi:hypothetical protein
MEENFISQLKSEEKKNFYNFFLNWKFFGLESEIIFENI